MDYKKTLWKVFDKYRRMEKIVANPITQKVTQSFDNVVVMGGIRGNTLEKMIINKADAQAYIYLIDKAVEQLSNTKERPFQDIINYKYKKFYSANRISIMIEYSIETYFRRLRTVQKELVEILDLWGININ